MSTMELLFDNNFTAMDYQPDSELLFTNYLYGTNNFTIDFDNSNFNLIINNLSKALNISPENLSHYVNDSTYQKKERYYREALTLISIITVFYAIIFISGIIGNLITCIVISRNKYMHTATNFYLFNLAISDLLLLLSGLPQETYSLWYPRSYPFTDFVCILESTLLETAANVTVLTITAFSVERYIAICHPFRQHSMSKLSRAIKFIFVIWLTAFILALPQAMQFAVIAEHESTSCTLKNWFYGHVFAVSGCVFFVGPMTAICVLYVLIGIKLKKSKLLQGVKRYDRGISAQTRVIRMLIAVAVAFFLCWAPFHAQRLMAVYGSTVENPSKLFKKVFPVLNHVSGVMYYLSTCINPLLYNIMSHKFRNAFKLTLARQCGLFRSYQTQNNNYYSALPRRNGSMRLNMSSLDHRTIVMQLNKRESDLSLLQDNNTNSSTRHLSMRSASMTNHYRCVSVTSQSTLMTTLSKNDIYSTVINVTPNRNQHLVNNYSSNKSSNFNNNRQILSSGVNTMHDSNNSYNTRFSPAPLQTSFIDDNFDEFADCHRLKNVQRYQQNVLPKPESPSSPLYFNNQAPISAGSKNDNYHQLRSISTADVTKDQVEKPMVEHSIESSISSKSVTSDSSHKLLDSHPKSFIALSNGRNKTLLNSGNLRQVKSDNNHHHQHNHQHHNRHRKRNKKEFDSGLYKIIKNNRNAGDTLSVNSSNISSSCSCSSYNSSCSDTNKCDIISISTPNFRETKLNNEIFDLSKISQLKQSDGTGINNYRIQNNLSNNHLIKSNSFSNNLIPETKLSDLNISKLILNQTVNHSKTSLETTPQQIADIVALKSNKSTSSYCTTITDKSVDEEMPSENINKNKKLVTINKDNNHELLNTTNVNLNVNKIEIDTKTQNLSRDNLDKNLPALSDSMAKTNLVKIVSPATVVSETPVETTETTKQKR